MNKNVKFYILSSLFLLPFIGRLLINGDRDPAFYGLQQILLDPNVFGLIILFTISVVYIIFNFKKFIFTTTKMKFYWLWFYVFVGVIANAVFMLPLISYFYAFEFATVILFAAVFYSIIDTSDIKRNIMFLYWVSFGLIFISFLSNITKIGFSNRLDGGLFALNPNILGVFAAIVSLFSIYLLIDKKRIRFLFIFLLSFIVLILTNSRTMYFAFFTGIVFLLLLKKERFNKTLFIYLSFFLLLIILVISIFVFGSNFKPVSDFVLRGQSADQLSGLTGRTEGWSNALSYIKDNPVLGYGFKGSRLIATEGLTHSHNVFIEIVLSTGLLGLFFWLMILFTNLGKLIKIRTKSQILLSIMFIVLLVDGLMSASFCYSNFKLYFLVNVFGCIYLLEKRRKKSKIRGLRKK